MRVHGVYSGRTDGQSDIGFVWKRSAVVDILSGGTPPADDILFGTRWPDEIRTAARDPEASAVITDYLALDPADWSCEALEDLARRCERLQELGPNDDEGLDLQGSPIMQPAMTAHSRAVEHDGEYQRMRRRFDRGANARFHALFREQIAAHAAAVGDTPVTPAKVVEIVARLEQVLRSFAATARPPA